MRHEPEDQSRATGDDRRAGRGGAGAPVGALRGGIGGRDHRLAVHRRHHLQRQGRRLGVRLGRRAHRARRVGHVHAQEPQVRGGVPVPVLLRQRGAGDLRRGQGRARPRAGASRRRGAPDAPVPGRGAGAPDLRRQVPRARRRPGAAAGGSSRGAHLQPRSRRPRGLGPARAGGRAHRGARACHRAGARNGLGHRGAVGDDRGLRHPLPRRGDGARIRARPAAVRRFRGRARS